jgi:hypothetical protein
MVLDTARRPLNRNNLNTAINIKCCCPLGCDFMRCKKEVNLCLIEQHAIYTCVVYGSVGPTSRPGHFTSGEGAPSTHWIGGWVDPRAGLVDVEKRKFLTLLRMKLRTPWSSSP